MVPSVLALARTIAPRLLLGVLSVGAVQWSPAAPRSIGLRLGSCEVGVSAGDFRPPADPWGLRWNGCEFLAAEALAGLGLGGLMVAHHSRKRPRPGPRHQDYPPDSEPPAL